MTVEVVVPFRGGCPHRERAWRWVGARYEAEGLQIVEAPGPEGPWCKGAAVNPAVAASHAEIVAVVDADAWLPGLGEAVAAVEDGAAWALPHLKVNRLTEEATAAVLSGAPFERQQLEQRPYVGVIGGGAVIARKEVIEAHPMDERFTGWG